jgi:hypothetical protein
MVIPKIIANEIRIEISLDRIFVSKKSTQGFKRYDKNSAIKNGIRIGQNAFILVKK